MDRKNGGMVGWIQKMYGSIEKKDGWLDGWRKQIDGWLEGKQKYEKIDGWLDGQKKNMKKSWMVGWTGKIE